MGGPANQITNTAATTAAVTNRIVTTRNMSLTTYTIANASPVWSGGANITVTVTTADTADTLGTVTIAGTNLLGQAISESITPIAGSAVSTAKIFRTVTAVTSIGWVIDAVEGTPDTIVVGVAAGNLAMGSGGILHSVLVNNAVATAVTVSDKRGTILTIPASQAAGSEFLLDVEVSGFLKVATTDTNNISVVHTGTLPIYATA